jgi:hypothetical protein
MSEKSEPEVLSAAVADKPSSKEAREDKRTEDTMRDYFASQKKVSVKTSKDEWVQVNGYTYIIKGGDRVDVPLDIATILEEAGRI